MKAALLSFAALWTLSGGAQAQSKFHVGLRAGANLASISSASVEITSGSTHISSTTSPILGWQAGLQAEWVLSKELALQPAVVLSQKGVSGTQDINNIFGSGSGNATVSMHTDVSARPLYVELPLHLVYSPAQYPGLQLLAGPYLAVGVGGGASLSYTLTSNDPSFPTHSGSTTLAMRYGESFPDLSTYNSGNNNQDVEFVAIAQARRIDAGLDVGVGYRSGPWQAQLIYGLGLVNSQPTYTDPTPTAGTGGNADASGDVCYHRVGQLALSYFFGGTAKSLPQ